MSINRRGSNVKTIQMSRSTLLVRSVVGVIALLLVVTVLGVVGTVAPPAMIAGWIVLAVVMLVLVLALM
ncbi:MAG: hypothetical protein NVS2B16_16340 [Chloroflexota bacterium]